MHPTTYNAKAYSAASATSALAATTIPRRDPTERDVQIDILFCGICHSDLHSVRNEWSEFMPTVYPIVPGHEIVGRVGRSAQQLQSTNPATSSRSAVWSTRIVPVRSAKLVLNSTAQTWSSP